MKTARAIRIRKPAFTLIELMVATAISLILVLGALSIASNSMKAYNFAMDELSTVGNARMALDTLATDLQAAVIRDDGHVWLESCADPDTSLGANSNLGTFGPTLNECATNILFFSTPPDRDRFRRGAVGGNRQALAGDICALRYRLRNINPLPSVYGGDANEDRIYGLYRGMVNSEDTGRVVIPLLADTTSRGLNASYWGLNTVSPPGGASVADTLSLDPNNRSDGVAKEFPANLLCRNVVALQCSFVFEKSDPATTPSTWRFLLSTYTAALPSGFSGAFGAETSTGTVTWGTGTQFSNLKVTGGKFAINSPTTAESALTWRTGRIVGAYLTLIVLDDTGADLVRIAQKRAGKAKLDTEEWMKIYSAHSRSFCRYVPIGL